ncbi:MAG: SMC family ATPase [Gemmatimonadota bacterium]|nr:MAG: SMC family ATPase [Gemmatimonadota bacterium]
MRLIRLDLKNFRQHADTELEFRAGLTGIIGPNGAGKTTILEAIAWAIYGAPAVRGTKDTLRFNRATGRAPVRAELEFELRGERYRVLRTPRSAELYRAESGEPIASGISEVTHQLTRRLGMTRREFFNTYFTGQKELQFLAAMGSAERGRFLSQVLGYERLRVAQNEAREQRKVLKGQVEELQRSLGDPEEIRRERAEAEARFAEASALLGATEARQSEAASRLADLEPAWAEVQGARERDRQLREELRVAEARLERVLADRAEAAAEIERLAADAERLKELRRQGAALAGLRQEDEELRVLAEADSRRKTLQKQLDEQRQRVEALMRKVTEQEERGRARDDLAAKLASRREESNALERQLEEAMSRWQRDRQDVDARLRILRDQAAELKAQIQQLQEAGRDGSCPTCKRPLGSEYEDVLKLVREQFELAVQDGKWHRKRLEQLSTEPAEVGASRDALTQARKEDERLVKDLNDVETALAQAAAFRAERDMEEARARELAGEIAVLPEGYDEHRHAEVREGLKRLAELETQITQAETRLERQAPVKKELAEAEEEERQVRANIAAHAKGRADLAFSEERYQELNEAYESARVALGEARLALERARGEGEAARQAVDAARRAEREYEQLRRSIGERQRDHGLHSELDQALGALRDELNSRVRPELSEVASVFLTELTDGRYNRIEITRDYEVVVLDDGEEKPVISGGEEDLANLVLRLAISQMIADRAGQTLNLLIFDEVFGGLDEQRRGGVVRLLQRLQGTFEQVILITHIESIREGMDHVVRVAFDERSGSSAVVNESPGASSGELLAEDLATLVGG